MPGSREAAPTFPTRRRRIRKNSPRIGLILSYFSDYLFPQVYEGIESVLREEGYEISVSVTRNRLNDEALYLKGMLGRNVSGLIIEGTRSSFPNPNSAALQ